MSVTWRQPKCLLPLVNESTWQMGWSECEVTRANQGHSSAQPTDLWQPQDNPTPAPAGSRARVARLMAKNNISATTRRKFKVTTNSKHHYPVSPDLLNQDFNSDAPNQIWVSDITYIRTMTGWWYLTVILDLFNRQVVGWSLSHRLTAITTTLPALNDAVRRQRPDAGLIFHSDRGVQYACHEFRNQLAAYQMVQSMSGKGNCYDNAVAESFFHTLMTELVYFEQYETKEQARHSIFEYLEVFYNRQRLHSALGY